MSEFVTHPLASKVMTDEIIDLTFREERNTETAKNAE